MSTLAWACEADDKAGLCSSQASPVPALRPTGAGEARPSLAGSRRDASLFSPPLPVSDSREDSWPLGEVYHLLGCVLGLRRWQGCESRQPPAAAAPLARAR